MQINIFSLFLHINRSSFFKVHYYSYAHLYTQRSIYILCAKTWKFLQSVTFVADLDISTYFHKSRSISLLSSGITIDNTDYRITVNIDGIHALSLRLAANCNVERESAVVWNLRVSGITMRFHEYVARLLAEDEEKGWKEKEKLHPKLREGEYTRWMERTEIARVCGRERPRSGIIYGPTRKVRKIRTGFAETTLVYAMDLDRYAPRSFASQRVDDVYEFFNRVTYFTCFPRRIISTVCKREKNLFFLSFSIRFHK